jgi:hypothetical protein
MLKLIYAAADAAFAEQVKIDLAASEPVDDLRDPGASQQKDDVLVAVVTAETFRDPVAAGRIYDALDQFQHIVPVLPAPIRLPTVLNNLVAIDYTRPAAAQALLDRIEFVRSDAAPQPMRVLTPRTRRSNRNVVAVFAALAASMFCIGLLAIGGGVSRPPEDEYDAVATAIQGTVDIEIQTELQQYMLFLPANASDAADYPATLQQVPTRYRPFMAMTATGAALLQETQAAQTAMPATPSPTAS